MIFSLSLSIIKKIREMNKVEEQLARDLIQNIKDAQRNSLTLAAITGDEDFE